MLVVRSSADFSRTQPRTPVLRELLLRRCQCAVRDSAQRCRPKGSRDHASVGRFCESRTLSGLTQTPYNVAQTSDQIVRVRNVAMSASRIFQALSPLTRATA